MGFRIFYYDVCGLIFSGVDFVMYWRYDFKEIKMYFGGIWVGFVMFLFGLGCIVLCKYVYILICIFGSGYFGFFGVIYFVFV